MQGLDDEGGRKRRDVRMGAPRRALRSLGIVVAAVVLLSGGAMVGLQAESVVASWKWRSVVSEVVAAPLPELVTGATGYARSGDLLIWYEAIPPQGDRQGVVLLMMGMGDDALGWPRAFIDAFLERGHMVVRYDHRGTGLSSWDIADTRFTLEDMAGDARAVLDALGIARAHVVGHSMGGMVAQQFALSHPERTVSLTSIASSANVADAEIRKAPRLMQLRLIWAWASHILRRGGERSLVGVKLAERRILTGTGPWEIDVRSLAQAVLYNVRKRRGYNLRAMRPHMNAMGRSGSRREALGALTVPALVIHGRDDRAMAFAHGEKTARAIPGARTLWVDGMGHDIPDPLAGPFADAILALGR
ncbi:MAG: alpha/beta hydrolase [Salinarimonas sp.]